MTDPERGDLAKQSRPPRSDPPRKKPAKEPAAPAQGPREARPKQHESRS